MFLHSNLNYSLLIFIPLVPKVARVDGELQTKTNAYIYLILE